MLDSLRKDIRSGLCFAAQLCVSQGLEPVVFEVFSDIGKCLLSDTPARCVDDPLEGCGVLRIGDETQIRKKVLNFRPVIKRNAAYDGVRDMVRMKTLSMPWTKRSYV